MRSDKNDKIFLFHILLGSFKKMAKKRNILQKWNPSSVFLVSLEVSPAITTVSPFDTTTFVVALVH
jgi:hypothetical protein